MDDMTGGQKALDQTLAGCNNPGTSGDSQLQGREGHRGGQGMWGYTVGDDTLTH